MKFRCERDRLVDALASAGRAVSGRGTVSAATNGVRIEVRGNQMTATGTDLDLTLAVSAEVVGLDDGVCVAPARLLADIVRALEPGAVTVEATEDEVEIAAGRSRFVVRTYESDEFPMLPDVGQPQVWLPTASLVDGLRQVVRAASTDDARPLLTGVLLSMEDSGLRLVATDSYRLAWRDVAGSIELPAGTKEILVPARALTELQRLVTSGRRDHGGRAAGAGGAGEAGGAGGEDGGARGASGGAGARGDGAQVGAFDGTRASEEAGASGGEGADAGADVVGARGGAAAGAADGDAGRGGRVGFAVGELQATFWVDQVRVTTRLLDGRFPDYRQLVPASFTTTVQMPKGPLLDALRRVRLLVRDNTTPVRLSLHPDGVDLTVVSQEMGQANEGVDGAVTGDEVTVAFNPSYLIDGVDAVDGDDVVLEVLDSTKPAIVRAPTSEDYRYLLMPVRVS